MTHLKNLRSLQRAGFHSFRVSQQSVASFEQLWWSSGQYARLLCKDPSSNPAENYIFLCKICV